MLLALWIPTIAVWGQATGIAFISPSNGTVLENQVGNSLTITITVGGPGGLTDDIFLYWTNPDSPLLNEILLATETVTFNATTGQGSFSYTFPGTTGFLDTTGTYSFRTEARGGSASATFSYHVPENGTVPTATITYPTDGSQFLPGQTITITANAFDGDGTIQRVEFLLGNNTATATGDEAFTILASDTAAPYETTFTVPGVGEYKLSARAYDGRGNAGRSQIITFFGSETPVMQKLSSVTFIQPDDGATISMTGPVNFAVNVQPASLRPLTTVDYYVDGYKINASPVSGSSTTDTFLYTWTNAYIGTVTVEARAQLNNGDFVETSNDLDITLTGYGSSPNVTLTKTAGDNPVAGSEVTFSALASDSGGLIQSLSFYANGSVVETVAGPASNTPYGFTFTYPGGGNWDFWVIAEFSNGNRAISNIVTEIVGLGVPPTVSIVSPVNGMQFLPGTNLPILPSANDPNSLIDEILYFVNDNLVNTATRGINGSFGVLTYTYQFQFAGDYRIYVQARDETGLISQSNVVRVTVSAPNPDIPAVVMTHPLPVGGGDTLNDVSTGSSMFINAYAQDNEHVDHVKFFINGQEIGSTSARYENTFAQFYYIQTPGDYIFFAEAVDQEGNRSHATPVQLQVSALETQLPRVEMLPLAEEDLIVDAGSEITLRATADGGLVQISQLNFYVNGTFVDSVDTAEDGVYTSTVVLEEPGTYLFNVRAVEVEPVGLPTDNWVISDSVAAVVEAASTNRSFVLQTYQDYFAVQLNQTSLDVAVNAMDSGQLTQAGYVHQLLDGTGFLNHEYALMARFLLTGAWPGREIFRQDLSRVESVGLSDLVSILLPSFQSIYWSNQRIPDGFSSQSEFENFFRILFRNKYGVEPSGDQLSTGVNQLKVFGANLFVEEFIKDTEASAFGSGSISTILGIPNPPNSRLEDYAETASLYMNLLRVTPSPDEVANLSTQSLLQRIQTILDDPRYAAR